MSSDDGRDVACHRRIRNLRFEGRGESANRSNSRRRGLREKSEQRQPEFPDRNYDRKRRRGRGLPTPSRRRYRIRRRTPASRHSASRIREVMRRRAAPLERPERRVGYARPRESDPSPASSVRCGANLLRAIETTFTGQCMHKLIVRSIITLFISITVGSVCVFVSIYNERQV